MFDWDEVVRLESNEDFFKRLLAIAECSYIENEKWLLLKIKQLVKMRLNILKED
jgi:hypothetical protein